MRGERARQIRSGNGEPSPHSCRRTRGHVRLRPKFQTEGISDLVGKQLPVVTVL
jgi:hypothetical protein